MTRQTSALIKCIVDKVGVVRVNNAMNPLLWLSAITMVCLCVTSFFAGFQAFIATVMIGFAMIIVLLTVIIYIIWMFIDPDRLQSEEYLLKQKELSIKFKEGAEFFPNDVEVKVYSPSSKHEAAS